MIPTGAKRRTGEGPPTADRHAHRRPTASLRRLPLLAAAVLLSGAGCPSESDPVTSAPPGTHVPAPPPAPTAAPAVYTAGEPVHINWSGTWYVGRVLNVGAGEYAGQYRIHYDGWADSWDAWVTPEKLRLPSAGVATGSRPT